MRSVVCNPQLVAECNHFRKKMYVIQNLFWYVINPKDETYKPDGLMTYRLQSKRITYAYRRLHANPSDWIEKSKSFDLLFSWSGLRGSNPPPPPWQGGALPNELNPRLFN